MLAKQNMVKSASLRMRNKTNAQNVACNLTNKEVTNAVHAIGNGTVHARSQTNGDSFLRSVDVVARSVGHTNEAAKSAQNKAKAIQHHLGMSSFFLTVTPDDDSSFLMQVYARELIDDITPIADLSDDELTK